MTATATPARPAESVPVPVQAGERLDVLPLGPRTRRWTRVAVLALAVVFVASGLVQDWQDSPTVDEGVDLASGLAGWVRHDLRMNPEHPPLPKLLATLPALAARPIVPDDAAWRDGDWFDHADSVLRANDRAGRLHLVLFLSRLVPLAEAAGCALFMYWLGRDLFGEVAGLLSAGLWLTTPMFLGLGHVQSIDVTFTFATLGFAVALLAHRRRPTLRRAAVVGVTLALALLTRHTGLVLVPVGVVAVAARTWFDRRHAVRAAVTVLLVAYLGLWAGYRAFDPTPPTGAPAARYEGIIGEASHRSAAARLVLAVPAPTEWRAGFGFLTITSDQRPAWLAGQAWEGSRLWYFPATVLLKVPLGALLALVGGAAGWLAVGRRARRDAAIVLAAPALMLFGLTALQPLDLGMRLVLPSVALALVAAGPVVAVARRQAGRIALIALASTQLAAVVAAGPHTLAWSPPPFRPAYRWVSDSNVDFGQGLWELRDWTRTHPARVAVVTPRGLGVPDDARPLVGADPSEVRGWVAAGVTALTVVDRDQLAWLRAWCPVGQLAGGAILVYRFDRPPGPGVGPTTPAAPCGAGERFSRRVG
ncbi:MAG: glycosyltransferase family 39 protein [Acidimicrobiia bacterium]|nr:glycosyltransferase family 39 protein [Acidimicrobiia bacterium]